MKECHDNTTEISQKGCQLEKLGGKSDFIKRCIGDIYTIK